jgi:hypothetical protein
VTVTPPTPEAAGTTSPGAAAIAYVAALNTGKVSNLCPLVEPSAQSVCQQAVAGAPPNTGTTFKNVALGYVAIDGTQALVGLTGTYCDPSGKPTCTTNTDPAALFSAGKPFATLFRQAEAALNSTSNAYSLAPFIQVSSTWYLDIPAKDL